nr:hypothetical protein CFP56_63508 [Quercus suber]
MAPVLHSGRLKVAPETQIPCSCSEQCRIGAVTAALGRSAAGDRTQGYAVMHKNTIEPCGDPSASAAENLDSVIWPTRKTGRKQQSAKQAFSSSLPALPLYAPGRPADSKKILTNRVTIALRGMQEACKRNRIQNDSAGAFTTLISYITISPQYYQEATVFKPANNLAVAEYELFFRVILLLVMTQTTSCEVVHDANQTRRCVDQPVFGKESGRGLRGLWGIELDTSSLDGVTDTLQQPIPPRQKGIPLTMDHIILLHSNRTDLAAYLRQIAARSSTKAVTDELLSAVLTESIPPKIFHVWLSASHDASVIQDAVHQDHSRTIRSAGIRHFGRLFRGQRIHEAWKAIGGIPGILNVLSRSSVYDVKKFCAEVGKGGTIQVESALRQRYTDELFKALCHQHFPETKARTTDPRPLVVYYQELLPACSPELMVRHVENEIKLLKSANMSRLLQAHSSIFRERYLNTAMGQTKEWPSMKNSTKLFRGLPTDTPTEQDPRISTSMLFAVQVLQRLTQEHVTNNNLSNNTFEREVATPLLRKLARRKCSPAALQEVVRMLVLYRERYIPEGYITLASFEQGRAIWAIVSRWVRHPDQLEKSLIDFLGSVSKYTRFDGQALTRLITAVPLQLRCRLLELVMKYHSTMLLDLASDVELQTFKEKWPVTLLLATPASYARGLLERLTRLNPEGVDMDWQRPSSRGESRSWISYRHLSLQHNNDPTCLMILLSRDLPGSLEKAELAIEERKKEAITSRDQSDRALWVKTTLDCAVASGSLEVYQKTLSWARRFNKDQNTAREIYSSASIHTAEVLDLLCGFPEDCDISNITIEDVRSNILLANRICRELFDCACVAQRERSFHQQHWDPIMGLLEKVTRMRLGRVNQLQDSLGLSDGDVFDAVWKDTLDTCLALEQSGLAEDQSLLGFCHVGGPLQRSWEKSVDLEQPRSAALRFIDDLAKRRNAMWETYRIREKPSTVTLPTLYPRGLPVQYMLPLETKNWREGFDLPYLRQRAEVVVFADPQSALSLAPEEKEVRVTRGPLIDQYGFALKLFVCSYPIREQQALAAWKHATGPLSNPRMSAAEAFLFWKEVFTTALDSQIIGPWSHSYVDKLKEPEIPSVDNYSAEDPVEWNPDPEAKQYEVKYRNLDVTILDEMVHHIYDPYNALASNYCKITTFVSGSTVKPLWDRFTVAKTSPKTQEALIAAALLHLNGKRCSSQRLLRSPFPSNKLQRFPALFLDDEFLDRKDLDDTCPVVGYLQRVNEAVPPTLLLQLVKALFTELEANEQNAKLVQDAFAMLKLLSTSERPELALHLIVEVILNRPDDSTWHRSLVNPTLFAILPAEKAKDFMKSLAHSIQMRLHGKSARPSDIDPAAKLPRLPAVKITTAKLLAQLTSGTEVMDEEICVGILSSLISSASHLDIRVAVVQSLIHVFADSSDYAVKNSVLDVLQKHAVPIAGSLNEQIRLTENDWEAAEGNQELIPEVFMDTAHQDLGPILCAIVGAVKLRKMSDQDRADFISKLLLPSLELSAQVNQRWMSLYFRSLGVPNTNLPKVPVKLRFLCSMFDHPSYLPGWAAESWLEVFSIDRHPPPAIARINSRISEDVVLRQSNAGKHWLSMWKQEKPFVSENRFILTKLLVRDWWTRVDGGITHGQIQNLVLKQADILIKTSDERFSDWDRFVAQLRLPFEYPKLQANWQSRCRPVVEKLIHHIKELRTPAWQKDPSRFPALLPNTFNMELWGLTYPHLGWSSHDSDLTTLADEVSNIIDGLARYTSSIYCSQYDTLESALVRASALPDVDLLHLALALGDVTYLQTRPVQVADLLRNKFAAAVLSSISNSSNRAHHDRSVIRALLRDWLTCDVEEIRMRGFAVRTAWSARDGSEWAVTIYPLRLEKSFKHPLPVYTLSLPSELPPSESWYPPAKSSPHRPVSTSPSHAHVAFIEVRVGVRPGLPLEGQGLRGENLLETKGARLSNRQNRSAGIIWVAGVVRSAGATADRSRTAGEDERGSCGGRVYVGVMAPLDASCSWQTGGCGAMVERDERPVEGKGSEWRRTTALSWILRWLEGFIPTLDDVIRERACVLELDMSRNALFVHRCAAP